MAASAEGKRFALMNGREKIVFLVKLVVFLATFGFAFPTVLHRDDYVEKYT